MRAATNSGEIPIPYLWHHAIRDTSFIHSMNQITRFTAAGAELQLGETNGVLYRRRRCHNDGEIPTNNGTSVNMLDFKNSGRIVRRIY